MLPQTASISCQLAFRNSSETAVREYMSAIQCGNPARIKTGTPRNNGIQSDITFDILPPCTAQVTMVPHKIERRKQFKGPQAILPAMTVSATADISKGEQYLPMRPTAPHPIKLPTIENNRISNLIGYMPARPVKRAYRLLTMTSKPKANMIAPATPPIFIFTNEPMPIQIPASMVLPNPLRNPFIFFCIFYYCTYVNPYQCGQVDHGTKLHKLIDKLLLSVSPIYQTAGHRCSSAGGFSRFEKLHPGFIKETHCLCLTEYGFLPMGCVCCHRYECYDLR